MGRRTTFTRLRRSGMSDRRVSFCPQVPVFFYSKEEDLPKDDDEGEWYDATESNSDDESEDESQEQEQELTDTTVMIRNLPNKYTQRRMLDVLIDPAHRIGKFNYLYMPMDLRHKCNVGYGFINFRKPVDALDFKNRFCGFKLPDTNSKKVFEVSFAKTQGLEANIREVKSRAGTSSRSIPEAYKPMFFDEDMSFIPMPELK